MGASDAKFWWIARDKFGILIFLPDDIAILGDHREDVCDHRAPIEPFFIDEMRGDVAGDDRLFMDIGHFQDLFSMAPAQKGRAVLHQTVDERLIFEGRFF